MSRWLLGQKPRSWLRLAVSFSVKNHHLGSHDSIMHMILTAVCMLWSLASAMMLGATLLAGGAITWRVNSVAHMLGNRGAQQPRASCGFGLKVIQWLSLISPSALDNGKSFKQEEDAPNGKGPQRGWKDLCLSLPQDKNPGFLSKIREVFSCQRKCCPTAERYPRGFTTWLGIGQIAKQGEWRPSSSHIVLLLSSFQLVRIVV